MKDPSKLIQDTIKDYVQEAVDEKITTGTADDEFFEEPGDPGATSSTSKAKGKGKSKEEETERERIRRADLLAKSLRKTVGLP